MKMIYLSYPETNLLSHFKSKNKEILTKSNNYVVNQKTIPFNLESSINNLQNKKEKEKISFKSLKVNRILSSIKLKIVGDRITYSISLIAYSIKKEMDLLNSAESMIRVPVWIYINPC